jgi:hypothetical protein
MLAAAAICVAAPATAAAVDDTTPPTVPQNVHAAVPLAAGNPVVSWDPSTDNGSGVYHYWVLVEGQQRARPSVTHYDIQELVDLERITPGPHVITILAVDYALNRSAPSDPIDIVVVQ